MKPKKRGPKSFTVMILPNPTSKTYRFSITRKQIQTGIIGASVFSMLFFFLVFHFIYKASDLQDLQILRKENRFQKVEIQTLSTRFTDLNKKMSQLKELDTKIRIIADIDPPKEGTPLLAQGGGAEDVMDFFSPTWVSFPRSDSLKKMDRHLARLEEEVLAQEVSFVELEAAMRDKRKLWSSTPSIKPVRGWVTSGFGKRISPFTGNFSMHRGIDIAARHGTEIVSPANGVVSYIGFDSRLGKVIKINHGYGMKTMYGHMSKTEVKVGQKVKRGGVIGYIGNTGMSTGPHLHYSVYVNNVPVNPKRHILN